MKKLLLANQSGQLTFDFMIAITISLGLFILFFAMTYSFTTVEISQYVAYSAARAQAGSNTTPENQASAAVAKVQYLTTNPNSAISLAFTNGWFQMSSNKVATYLGNGLAQNPQLMTPLADASSSAYFENVFTGVSIPFTSNIFNYQVPFISNSGSSATGDDTGFVTNINAVMIREPAVSECQDFWNGRNGKGALQKLPSGQGYSMGPYAAMEDNGC